MTQGRVSLAALLASAIALASAVGCGVPTIIPVSTQSNLNINGNWDIVSNLASGAGLASPIASFSGALQSSNGAVTGTLHALDTDFTATCVSLTQDLPATGTLDAANNLTLSVAVAGGTATIQLALDQSLLTFATGTYSIAGGACAMSSTPMIAIQIPPVTGAYSGTLTELGSSPAVTATVTAQLTQSSTPNADGNFPSTGTVTIAGSTCPATFSFSGELVAGPALDAPQTGAQSGTLSGALLPPLPPAVTPAAPWPILATVASSGTNCPMPAPLWTGTLTPQ
ncbi:MAG: hypothetical protein ABR910_00640 [Acidobacteriaceae bacterium]|jgi:hypothetical protein